MYGVADRIDRSADGSLAIVDYKTGSPPRTKAVAAGFAMQLGLLGLIARTRASPTSRASRRRSNIGRSPRRPTGSASSPARSAAGTASTPEDFTGLAERNFTAAAIHWLTGDAPFTAKLHPEYAPYGDYDQLMRRDEWYGREG